MSIKRLDALDRAYELCLTVAGEQPQGLPWGYQGRKEERKAEPGDSRPPPLPHLSKSRVMLLFFFCFIYWGSTLGSVLGEKENFKANGLDMFLLHLGPSYLLSDHYVP